MTKRACFDAILIGALFVLPWYVTAGLAVAGLLLFRKFWEIIIAGFLIDALYSLPDTRIIGRFGFFTMIGAVLFLTADAIKKELRT